MVDVKGIISGVLVVGAIGLLYVGKITFDQAMNMITYGLVVIGVEAVYRLGKTGG